MTRIKICGIREESDALAAARAGADFIGLVFAPSQRRVALDRAEKITSAVKASGQSVEVVGVFANVPFYVVNRIAESCHLDRVQLSGDESWEYCALITRPLIKAVRVGSRDADGVCTDVAAGAKLLRRECIYLLDTEVRGKYGGTGLAFDWHLARPVAERFPVIVAGGLTPDNVGQAIRTAAPWGVDVSSGVETDGAKDVARIRLFIEAVRRVDNGQS